MKMNRRSRLPEAAGGRGGESAPDSPGRGIAADFSGPQDEQHTRLAEG